MHLINLCLKVYLLKRICKNTKYSDRIQISILSMKFDQIQAQTWIDHICICIYKYKQVFDPNPAVESRQSWHCTQNGCWDNFFNCITIHGNLFSSIVTQHSCINPLRPKQNGRHFADDIFICIFLNENEWHLSKVSLKFVPNVPINNIPTLVQIMA